jgi:hypothetical protein
MAQVNIEEVVDHLSSDFRRALEATIRAKIPNAQFDPHDVFREFVREVGRKCRRWEQVPDRHVLKD